ncbi:MAG: hypothetical protein PHP92_04870 [Candidatus Nanoarchaeia archaeon]|nr:hypothetical protein [Candidatus Nanoarchaeia archaeon]
MANKVKNLRYDARIFFCRFNRSPVRNRIYENEYYEIVQGLQNISINASRTGMGTATITIVPPLNTQNYPNTNILKKYTISVGEKWLPVNDPNGLYRNQYLNVLMGAGYTEQEALQKAEEDLIIGDAPLYNTVVGGVVEYVRYIRQEVIYEFGDLADKVAGEPVSSLTRIDIENNLIDYYPILDVTMMECVFQPMDKVRIWLSNRFQGGSIDDDDIDDVENYSQCFVGLVSNVTVVYSNGTIQININVKDLTRWLELSQFNVNPALASTKIDTIFGNAGITWSSTNLAQKSLIEIISILILGTEDSWTQIGHNNSTYVNDKKTLSTDQLNLKYKEETETKTATAQHGNQVTITIKKLYMKAPVVWGCGHFRLLPKNEGMKPQESNGLAEIQLDTSITDDTLWIDPAIADWQPYLLSMNNFELFQHQWKKRLDIIREIAAINDYEFFCDMDGKLIFKIPDYNVNPGEIIKDRSSGQSVSKSPTYDKDAEIMFCDDTYLIKQSEIISYSTGVEDDNIYTAAFIQGDMNWNIEEAALNNTDWEFDSKLANIYGARIIKKNIPLLVGSQNINARKMFAKAYLNRQNALYKSMQLTIPMRAELKLARPLAIIPFELEKFFEGDSVPSFKKYVDQLANMDTNVNQDIFKQIQVYYITGINHNYTVGNLCTTNLTLTHGRYWLDSFGVLEYKRGNIKKNRLENNPDDIQSQKVNKELVNKSSTQKMQMRLSELKPTPTSSAFYTGTQDGLIGNGTKKAVSDFASTFNVQYTQPSNNDYSYESVFTDEIVQAINEVYKQEHV